MLQEKRVNPRNSTNQTKPKPTHLPQAKMPNPKKHNKNQKEKDNISGFDNIGKENKNQGVFASQEEPEKHPAMKAKPPQGKAQNKGHGKGKGQKAGKVKN